MFHAKRAIILASGMGTRLRPFTETVPKPLIRVGSRRIIDSQIEGLLANGIRDIIVVVGYRKEQFQSLPRQYPHVRLLENPWYNTCNNISAVYAARAYLEEAMILEGDHYFFSPLPLTADFTHTEYNGSWSDKPSSEWMALTGPDGIITHNFPDGADHGWLYYGVSRWTPADGARLRDYITCEFEEKKNRSIFWDCVPLFLYPEIFPIFIRSFPGHCRMEIDTPEDLAAARELVLKGRDGIHGM